MKKKEVVLFYIGMTLFVLLLLTATIYEIFKDGFESGLKYIIVIIVALFYYSYTSMGNEIENLKESNVYLKKRIEDLKEEIKDLKEENKDLAKDSDAEIEKVLKSLSYNCDDIEKPFE